jgi:hypothetical protein
MNLVWLTDTDALRKAPAWLEVSPRAPRINAGRSCREVIMTISGVVRDRQASGRCPLLGRFLLFQPKIAFSRFPTVHRVEPGGRLRVDLTRSPTTHRRTVAVCASPSVICRAAGVRRFSHWEEGAGKAERGSGPAPGDSRGNFFLIFIISVMLPAFDNWAAGRG